MDYNQPLDSDFPGELAINGDIRIFLKEIAKWAQFLSIVGLAILGISLLSMVFMGTAMSAMLSSTIPGGSGIASLFMLFYALFLGVFAFPMIYSLRFALTTKAALKEDNQEALTLAFQYLKSHYKFWGISTSIFVIFYAIMLVINIGLFAF
ncbi:MAG: hypothetical protein ACI8YQ_001034 [Polaribacter sp.]|jgi:hypothetical protein